MVGKEAIKRKLKQLATKKESGNYWWELRSKYFACENVLLKAIRMLKYYQYTQDMGSHIPLEATFDSKPSLPHGIYGIFVSMGAHIGQDCVIFQQVTIGSNTARGSKAIGSPRIGDNVYIGAGAKIIGNICVGNNARIGANCVVTHDVPENATVVLGRERVIEHAEAPDNSFYYFDQLREIDSVEHDY